MVPKSKFPFILAVLVLASSCEGAPDAGAEAAAARQAGANVATPAGAAAPAPPPGERCEELGSLLGGSASASGDVCRVTFPRADLTVRLLGATLPAGMGLTAWAAFAPAGERGSIVMGDLALKGGELQPVMASLRENGLRVTAVHRHMVGESPAMSFMHYLGIGEAGELARSLAAALDAAPAIPRRAGGAGRGGRGEGAEGTAGGRARPGIVAGTPCEEIARILGGDPAAADAGPGYCKVSLPRSDLDVRVDGIPVPASLGIGSWFAFRETEDGGAAVIAGDMALTQEQVNSAIAALRERGIEVVALHNHMLFDEPRVVFFHFQARGAPGELARGLAAGLEAAGLAGPRTGRAGAAPG